MTMSLTRAALLACAFSPAWSPAFAASYTYSPIEVAAALQTNPTGMNDSGTVVGYSFDSNYGQHGFVFANGKLTSFDVPHSKATVATGIDDAGNIVGSYQDKNYNEHGFVLTASGKYRRVDLPGSDYDALGAISPNGLAVGGGQDSSSYVELYTYRSGKFTTVVDDHKSPVAAAINNKGAIAGTYEAPRSYEQAFLYANGTVTLIQIPGVTFTQSFGINKSNVVVGQAASSAGIQHGFVFKDGKARLIKPKGASGAFFTGINDAGAIVGDSFDSSNTLSGFVYDKGVFNFLAIPGDTQVTPNAINKTGQVMGEFIDPNGVPATFLATPAS